jgi:hypothetical protein
MPMPGTMGPGIPRPADVPTPFGAPMGQPGRSVRPPSDPFAGPPPSMGAPPGPVAGLPSGLPGPGPSARPPMSAPGALGGLGGDPFAPAAVGAAPREVRLVIDDKAVSDAEVGRQSGGKFAVAAVVVGLVGAAVGWFVGSTARERQMYDAALTDAKEIYDNTSKASPTVEKAAKLIDQAAKAAGGGKTVDFKAIEDLRALPKPFPADVFSRKMYKAFEAGTVDALFTYYNQTNQLWAKINAIAAKNLTPAARENLEKAAKAAGQYANSDFGCVPFKDGDNFACGLTTVSRDEAKENKDPKDKSVKVMVGGKFEKVLYTGQDLTAKTSDYVIAIDKARSGDILGSAKNPFDAYARDLMEAKTLADQTLEIQGGLVKKLSEIAKLESL